MKEKVKEKQRAYADLCNCTLEEEKEVKEARYKAAKTLAKEAITMAKNNAFERLYKKLDTKEDENRCLTSEGQGKENKGSRKCKMR